MRLTYLLRSILFLSSPIWMAKASVSVGPATECGPLAVSWTGELSLLIFIFSVNYSSTLYPVPPSAYSGNQGNYTIPQLPLSQGQQFVLSMYGGTGFVTGGTSNLLQVAGPTNGSSCNTTSSQTFSFEDSSLALQECEPYVFNDYQGAALPVSIVGIIPGGQTFVLDSNVTTTNYTWVTDIPAGTLIMFSMLDANSNSGGCSSLQTVGGSVDKCTIGYAIEGSQGLSSLPLNVSTSTSQTGSGPMSTSQTGSSSSSTLSTATIAAVVGGGVVALAALVIFGLCLIRRKRKDGSTYPTPTALDIHAEQLHHGPDTPATAYAYPVPYQSDDDQPFVSSGQTTQRITHPHVQEIHGFHRAPATLQQDPFVDTTTRDFAAHNDTAIPLGPSFARPAALHNIVVEHAPPIVSQVADPPPQYSELPGLAAGQRLVPRPLSSGTNLAYVPKSFD
ncbi:hypothetical protein BKA82DRAFT_29532 [Pisolithus tinctorius]|uniref:Mid2 domain-containing protein n=1 Tax=Pisolithus tinctorius Marx 270 TaxID=870435 RepID=A0A0C3NYM7_PISTI|nr:hypothetical protein BKA82DRAFT_29532 [Pisolithus tinctorius]KIO00376.1 hypothetical protein M404DRAFT_29532 [Pisolithus tinctorius Marx 270]